MVKIGHFSAVYLSNKNINRCYLRCFYMKCSILLENKNKFISKADAVVRKAKQFGFDCGYTLGEEFERYCYSDNTEHNVRGNEKYIPHMNCSAVRHMIDVEVWGEVRFKSFHFVATIEKKASGNVIRALDTTLTVPDKYRHTDLICEHCGVNRERKDTYLIYNDETGEFKQVGKTCLKLYTGGLSPEHLASLAEFLYSVDYLSESERVVQYVKTDRFIKACCVWYKLHFEYRNKNRSKNTMRTIESVLGIYAWLFPDFVMKEDDFNKFLYMSDVTTEQIDVCKGYDVQVVISDLSRGSFLESDFTLNIQVLLVESYLQMRDLNMLCYAVYVVISGRIRLEKTEARKRKEAEFNIQIKDSKYVGKVGDKLRLENVTGRFAHSFASQFGTMYIFNFIDKTGNSLIWFTSSKAFLSEVVKRNLFDAASFSVVTLTGTIKNHDEYDGIKQTYLTRCKVTFDELK